MKTTYCLAMAFFLVLMTMAYAQDEAPKHDYVGTMQCKMCHNKPDEGKQYSVWKLAKHAGAYRVLLGDKAKEVAQAQGLGTLPHQSPECLKCHVTGYDSKLKKHPMKIKKEEGVSCESCHGPASSHLKDGKAIRMKKDTTINVLDNLVKPDVKTCVQCHNDGNPTWDPEKYTLEDGSKVGFDFKQAAKVITHKNPKKTLE